MLAVPAATGLFLLSSQILLLIYGDDDFLQASLVLRIVVWTLILGVYSNTLGGILMAGHREKLNLWIVAVDTAVVPGCGGVLIGRFGLVGAAVTARRACRRLRAALRLRRRG